MSESDSWVAVAVVLRPHALGGGLMLKPLTRTVEEFLDAELTRVFVRRRAQVGRELKIASQSAHKNAVLAYFEGVDDRNGSEDLVGAELVIPENERWELPPGEFYTDQLVGLSIVDSPTGRDLGKLLRTQEGGAHDFFVFQNPDQPKKEMMLPNIPQFIEKIDLEGGRILVRLPEGLLEL